MIFSKEELRFINKELNLDAHEEEKDEALLRQIQEAAFEIELRESNRLEELTPRGVVAARLVTRLGEE